MNPCDVPTDKNDLTKLYIYTNQRINKIWKEYVIHTNLKYILQQQKYLQ